MDQRGTPDCAARSLLTITRRALDNDGPPKYTRSNGWRFGRFHLGESLKVTKAPVESTHLCWEHFGEKQNEVLLALCPQQGRQMFQNMGVPLATERS